jgi:hypothetical protein
LLAGTTFTHDRTGRCILNSLGPQAFAKCADNARNFQWSGTFMRSRTTRQILGLFSFYTLIACQPTAPQSSSLDHTLGQTTRSRTALSPCQAGDSTNPVIGYMQTIFNQLVSANTGTFQGIFDPSHFCLHSNADAIINGFAYIANGEIHLTKGLLLAVDHDADVAAVLAHELAHITMDHRFDLEHEKVVAGTAINELKAELNRKQDEYRSQKAEYYPNLIGIVEKDPALLESLAGLKSSTYMKYSLDAIQTLLAKSEPNLQEKAGLLDDFNNIRSQLNYEADDKIAMEANGTWKSIVDLLDRSDRELTSVRDRISELNQNLSDLPRDDLIADGAGAGSNWKEQEADEVGYEFYLRAGFRPDRFTHIHNILMAQSRSDGECQTLLRSGQLPPRGSASHPSSCWRIYNINQREAMVHADAYKPFMSNSKLSVTEGKLEEIKKGL